MPFYRCKLRNVVECYYDCNTWLSILKDAEADERLLTSSSRCVLGLDNCDLEPYVDNKTSDRTYQLSRAHMVDTLVSDSHGQSIVFVPPATLVEYVHGVLVQSKSLRHYLDRFSQLKETKSVEEFFQLIKPAYERARELMQQGNRNKGLKLLEKLFEDGKLTTTELLIKPRHREKLLECRTAPDPAGYDLLNRRRSGKDDYGLSCLVDMANWDFILAANPILIEEGHPCFMTTTGPLTLQAFRDSAPWLSADKIPARHLATPYLRNVLLHQEPGRSSRMTKLRIGKHLLIDIIDEIEKLPEAYAILSWRMDSLNPEDEIVITTRLVELTESWLKLFFLPFLKEAKDADISDGSEETVDITTIVDWTDCNRDEILRRSQRVPQGLRESIYDIGGFSDLDIVERFVPKHSEADSIVRWLAS